MFGMVSAHMLLGGGGEKNAKTAELNGLKSDMGCCKERVYC